MKDTFPYPISRKAYARFISTIETATPSAEARRSLINALNLYLLGHDTYINGLTPECLLAFEFLRFDIDSAIIRSKKARERARLRKEAKALASQSMESMEPTELSEPTKAEEINKTTKPKKPKEAAKPIKPRKPDKPKKSRRSIKLKTLLSRPHKRP